MITWQKLLPFLLFILSYSFGSYLFLREPRKAVNRLFIITMLTPFFGEFLHLIFIVLKITTNATAGNALFLLPVLAWHFIALQGQIKISPSKLQFFYLISLFFYFGQILVPYSPLPFLFLLGTIPILIGVIRATLQNLITDFEVRQFRFILFGILSNIILLGAVDLVSPSSSDALRWKMLSPLLLVLFVGGPILRMRLSNLWLVFRKGFAYALALTIFVAGYFGALEQIMRENVMVMEFSTYVASIFLIIFAVIFQPVTLRLRRFIDTILLPQVYDFPAVTEKLSLDLAGIFTNGELRNTLQQVLSETFRAEQVEIIDFSTEDKESQTTNQQFRILADKAKPALQRSLTQPLHLDELQRETQLTKFATQLITEGIHLMFPVSFNQKIQWLILLSARDGSGDYNSEDLQLITTISGQLAMALQKADAFRSLQKTNITLQQTIGELKATQLELARQERLAVIGRMAASIAHEVRNPLGVIKISARTLSNQFTEKESSARELADFINNEVDKLNRVVSDLLDFTREPARNFRPESMTTLIKNAQERAKTYGEVKIHFREPIEDIICDIDRDPMERVLTNLLINAIEATTDKDNGIVEIAISKHAKKVKIMVSDHGSGIHKEDQNNIFEPFFTTRQNGTGLGLAISARIISGHHGEIFVDKNYRNGCRMIIELPLHQSKS